MRKNKRGLKNKKGLTLNYVEKATGLTFTYKINNVDLTGKSEIPNITKFDETTFPLAHLKVYKNIRLQLVTKQMMCLAFSGTLNGVTVT